MTNEEIWHTQNPRRYKKLTNRRDQKRVLLEGESMKNNKIKCFVVVFVVAFILLCFASCALTKSNHDDNTIIVIGTEI